MAAHARGTRGVVRVRLTVIGCAGSFPSPDSPASSYLVEHARTQLLLDLGNGAFGSLLGQTDPRSIDAIIISHLHADHCADLVPLYVWLKYGPIPLPRKIPVYGPRGLAERIAGMYSAAGADLTDIFEFRTLRAQQPVDIGSMTVLPAIVAHPGESLAVRIATPSSTLVYSGDTAECDALVTLSAGADIALFEASCLESATPADAAVLGMHMSAAGAARVARRAGATSLVLTHTVQWQRVDVDAQQAALVDEARRHFGGEVTLASVGGSWEF